MSPLRIVGEALYGRQWQREMARALRVHERTVRRWAAGDTPVGPGVWADIALIALHRSWVLAELAGQIDAGRLIAGADSTTYQPRPKRAPAGR